LNIFSKPNFQITFSVLLILVCSVQWYLLLIAGFAIEIILIETTVGGIILSIICYVQGNLLEYYTPQKSRQFIILIWALVFALIWMGLTWFCMHLYFADKYAYLFFLKKTLVVRTFMAWQFISAIGFYNLLWQSQQLTLQTERMQQETKELAKDAELYKLRQQMQPHFLFNSLNSINALITIDPKKARTMIQQLSDYLRATLKKEEKELTTLQDELHYLQLYLEIEKVRFGHRLSAQINAEEQLLQMKIPSLLLQPALENAIKFGLYNTTEEVNIILTATMIENQLSITIQNPYDANLAMQKTGTGFGLKAIQRRLHLIFGQYDAIRLVKDQHQFTTQIFIPQAII
jgi:two-component system, LytTR family, sensor kinase